MTRQEEEKNEQTGSGGGGGGGGGGGREGGHLENARENRRGGHPSIPVHPVHPDVRACIHSFIHLTEDPTIRESAHVDGRTDGRSAGGVYAACVRLRSRRSVYDGSDRSTDGRAVTHRIASQISFEETPRERRRLFFEKNYLFVALARAFATG